MDCCRTSTGFRFTPALPADGVTLHIPPTAAPGSYVALAQSPDGWQCMTITVLADQEFP